MESKINKVKKVIDGVKENKSKILYDYLNPKQISEQNEVSSILKRKNAKYLTNDEILSDIQNGTINEQNAQAVYEELCKLSAKIDFSTMDIRHKIVELGMSQAGNYASMEEARLTIEELEKNPPAVNLEVQKLEKEFEDARECGEIVEKMANIIKTYFPKVLKPNNIL